MEIQRRKRSSAWKAIIWIILALIVAAVFVVFGLFRVREVDVIGNEFYSADEIQGMVMKGSLGENSLYLKWRYSSDDATDDMMFLNGVEISLVNPYHIQIRVYEKEIVGYILYSGSYVYFDKDGMVVDISQDEKEDVPVYSGVSIGQPEVQQELPVEDKTFLNNILEETGLLQELGITPKQIHYDENQEMILYFAKDLRVLMGKNSYMEEKMTNLLSLYPQMEGMSGTLHMEDFTAGTKSITFKKDESGEEELFFDVEAPESESANEVGTVNESESEEATEAKAEAENAFKPQENSFQMDTDGDVYYTDSNGNVTYSDEQLYLNEDGSLITDGYGYIDPYTGAYILN